MNTLTHATTKKDIVDLITGYRKSATLNSVLELGLLDELAAKTTVSIKEFAKKKQVDSDKLQRLLEYCQCFDLVKVVAGHVELDSFGAYFIEHPYLIDWAACELQPCYWKSWSSLTDGLQSNKTAFEVSTQMPFFEYLGDNDRPRSLFQKAMASQTNDLILGITKAYDFSKYNHIVDVGGGRGPLITKVVNENSTVKGTLFEREEVVDEIKDLPKSDRLDFVSGSFLETDIPDGDCLILKNILHDWNDDSAIKLLKKCCQSIDKSGTILVIEILKSDQPGQPKGKGLDMVMMNLFSGKERTLNDFKAIGREAGLTLTATYETETPLSIIEYKLNGGLQ